MHAGPCGVLTGLAAARRHGFTVPENGPVDVMVPLRVRRQGVGFVRIPRTARMPAEVHVAGEVRYARAERAVADAARSLTVERDVRAQAVQQQRCSIDLLAMDSGAGVQCAAVRGRDADRHRGRVVGGGGGGG
jgi:hypothetical protein